MAAHVWGKKIGMTQVFSADNKVVPVTAIDVGQWVITNKKTKERDGYDAVQVGLLKNRYSKQTFNNDWLKDQKRYFYHIREIAIDGDIATYAIGQIIDFGAHLNMGENIDVGGVTIGRGFAGVIKRHNFAGPPASHGSDMGRRPGSSGSFRSQGRVLKGKKFPGHMGTDFQVMKNLQVVSIDKDTNVILVKGSVPGKVGTLLCIRKNIKQ